MAKLGKCECADPGCNHHIGTSKCDDNATTILYRVDMEDQTGTAMCGECAGDAWSSGLFTDAEGLRA